MTDRLDAAFVKAMNDEDLKKSAVDRYYINLFGVYGDESMKILLAMESAVSWKLQDLGLSKFSPDKLGIAKP